MKHQTQIAKTTFGKRKLDPEAYAAQQAKKTRTTPQGIVFGKRKLSGPKAPEPVASPVPNPAPAASKPEPPTEVRNPFIPEGDADGSAYVTVSELEHVLTEKPELLEDAFAAEFRDGEPRKGALKVLLKIAEAQPQGDPRLARMIQVIKAH